MTLITLRVRSQIGTWRVQNVSMTDDFRCLRERLQKEHNAEFSRNGFSSDPSGNVIFGDDLTIMEAGLKNGDMIYADVDERKVGVHEATTMKKTITKDGRIMAQEVHTSLQATGFRPGLLPLRSMKMQWTLNEFMQLDEQFVYKVKAQEQSNCTKAVVNEAPLRDFQQYLRAYDYRMIRLKMHQLTLLHPHLTSS